MSFCLQIKLEHGSSLTKQGVIWHIPGLFRQLQTVKTVKNGQDRCILSRQCHTVKTTAASQSVSQTTTDVPVPTEALII